MPNSQRWTPALGIKQSPSLDVKDLGKFRFKVRKQIKALIRTAMPIASKTVSCLKDEMERLSQSLVQ